MKPPRSHPRYASLMTREKLVDAYRDGIVAAEGLIAHGRGEAFDYLFGERTTAPALVAEKASAAFLLTAKHPVLSVNGNVAALAAKPVVRLAKAVPAAIEVNLFHRTEARVAKVGSLLKRAGATKVLGPRPNARIPGLDSRRAKCRKEGIFSADVVLVPLEDGDRAEALKRMGKTVLAVDLNPFSRTAQAADVTIVDEVSRALRVVERFARELKRDPAETRRVRDAFDRERNRVAVLSYLNRRLRQPRA